MRLIVVFAIMAIEMGCGHTKSTKEHADELLWNLEDGYRLLRSDPTPSTLSTAKAAFADATARFEDTAGDDAWTTTWSADHTKAYRGWAHERVLTSVLLGALEANDNRCDLALPSLRNAMWFAARDAEDADVEPVALAAALVWWCTRDASLADRAHAENDARLALGEEHMASLQQASRLALAIHGRSPTLSAMGSQREATTWQPGHGADNDDQQAALMRAPGLGCGGHHLGKVVVLVLCRGTSGAVQSLQSLPLWSSTAEANSTRARRFEAVLAQRAAWRQQSDRQLNAVSSAAQSDFERRPNTTSVARWLAAGSASRLNEAMVNPAADLRYVESLPESVDLWLLR